MKFLHHFFIKKMKIQIKLLFDWNLMKEKEPSDRQSKNEFNYIPSFLKKRIKIVLLTF